VVSFAPQPLYTPGKELPGTNWLGDMTLQEEYKKKGQAPLHAANLNMKG
jgi:hypothetical protein